MELIFVVI